MGIRSSATAGARLSRSTGLGANANFTIAYVGRIWAWTDSSIISYDSAGQADGVYMSTDNAGSRLYMWNNTGTPVNFASSPALGQPVAMYLRNGSVFAHADAGWAPMPLTSPFITVVDVPRTYTPANLDILCDAGGFEHNGTVNDVAFWDVELTDEEIKAHFCGAVVRPQNLKFRCRLHGVQAIDDISGNNAPLVATGGLVTEEMPLMIPDPRRRDMRRRLGMVPSGASSAADPSSAAGPNVAATGAALAAGAPSAASGPNVSAAGAALSAAAPSSAAGPSIAATGASGGQAAPSSSAGPDVSATSAALKAVAPSSSAGPDVAATSAALKAAAPSCSPGPSVGATGSHTGGKTIYFRDDFNGSSLDSTIWTTANRQGDPANGELHCYVPSMVTVTGGNLQITSEAHTQSCGDDSHSPTSHNYRSGEILQVLAPFLYGTIRFRVRMPNGTGLWPIVWTLGAPWQAAAIANPGDTNPPGANWDTSPWNEVDILEIFSPPDSGTVKQIIHNGGQSGGDVSLGFDPTAAAHDYEWIWSSGSAIWKVDGVTTKTLTGAAVPSNPQFVMVSVAVGGNGGGGTVDLSAATPLLMDYIEVESDTANPSCSAGPDVSATSASPASGAPSSAAGPSVAATGASVFPAAPSSAAGPSVAATGTSRGAADGSCSAGPSVGGIGASKAAAAPSCTISPNIRATTTAPVTDNPFQGFLTL